MTVLSLSQWQFAITSIYHFFFVPLTLGLSILTAIMETLYVNSGQSIYKSMTQFWGKLFLINFAMGVVTGIVMEFQFGMNWSEYSRFVGDIFGAPLAVEALLAFFLESVFLGVWIFGWDKVSKGVHLLSIWLVTLAVNISSLWILAANSFMQEPVGYKLENGRAVMTNFFELLSNPHLWVQFPHTVISGFATGAFFVLGISAYHLFRKQNVEFFRRSFTIGAVASILATVLIILSGHNQAQQMVRAQPMKMAAAEALWESQNPASFSLISLINEPERKDVFAIRIPRMLSLLAYDRLDGEVKGINNLQAEYEQTYGAGNYAPPITVTYWSFRFMVGAGMVMLLIAAYALYHILRKSDLTRVPLIQLAPFAIALPYIANTAGWIMTELGRQPWIVFGLMKTKDAFSPTLNVGTVLASLIILTGLYGVLMVADIYLLVKFAKAGPVAEHTPPAGEEVFVG